MLIKHFSKNSVLKKDIIVEPKKKDTVEVDFLIDVCDDDNEKTTKVKFNDVVERCDV
jgi:hypothetical protein